MIEEKYIKIGERAMARDPRKYPFGYLTGGSFVLDSLRVFVWFKTLNELVNHIVDVEPRIYDLTLGDGLEEFQAKVKPLAVKLIDKGFNDALRKKINQEAHECFVIDWWGTYETLKAGRTAFSKEIISDFHGRYDTIGKSINEQQEKKFVRFLKDYSI